MTTCQSYRRVRSRHRRPRLGPLRVPMWLWRRRAGSDALLVVVCAAVAYLVLTRGVLPLLS